MNQENNMRINFYLLEELQDYFYTSGIVKEFLNQIQKVQTTKDIM